MVGQWRDEGPLYTGEASMTPRFIEPAADRVAGRDVHTDFFYTCQVFRVILRILVLLLHIRVRMLGSGAHVQQGSVEGVLHGVGTVHRCGGRAWCLLGRSHSLTVGLQFLWWFARRGICVQGEEVWLGQVCLKVSREFWDGCLKFARIAFRPGK